MNSCLSQTELMIRFSTTSFICLLTAGCSGIEMRDLVTPRPVPAQSCVVVGFLGGRGRWDDETREVRRAALRLRSPERSIHVETFENRRRDVAERFVIEALDRDGSGEVEPNELRSSRLVVYGLSFGGAAVVKFARQLEPRGIPVALTVQIDSVGRGDGRIPSNVEQALNLYQDNGWLIRGEHPVRADAPERTRLLGNVRFDYNQPPGSEISLEGVPWWALVFRVAHARMTRDPAVWSLVEQTVRGACAGEELSPFEVSQPPQGRD